MDITREELEAALDFVEYRDRYRQSLLSEDRHFGVGLTPEDTRTERQRTVDDFLSYYGGARKEVFDPTHRDAITDLFLEYGLKVIYIPGSFFLRVEDPQVHSFFTERAYVWFYPDGGFRAGAYPSKKVKIRAREGKLDNPFKSFLGEARVARDKELHDRKVALTTTNEARARRNIEPFPSWEAMQYPNQYARKTETSDSKSEVVD